MWSHMRQALVLVLLPGCNSVLGVEQLPRGVAGAHDGGGEAGPVVTYVDPDCHKCMQQNCASAEQECTADSSCATLDTCLAGVARNDLAGRAACYDANDIALGAHAGAAFDTCRRTQCLAACLGTGGVVAALGKSCGQCVDKSGDCQTAVKACFANVYCERKVAYYVSCEDNPNCRIQALFDVDNPGASADVEAIATQVADVRRCLTPCDSSCGICEDYACAGGYEWSHAPVSAASVDITLTVEYGGLTGVVSGNPANDVTVEVCAPQLGPGCTSVGPAKPTSSDGTVQLTLPLFEGRFDGHFYVHGGQAFPTHFFFGQPLWRSVDDYIIPVFTTAEYKSMVSLATGGQVTMTPGLGELGVGAYSCWRVAGGDLALGLDPGAGKFTGKYFPFSNKVTAPGVGDWAAINVEPGTRTLTASNGSQTVVAGYKIPVAPDALTELRLFPDAKAQ